MQDRIKSRLPAPYIAYSPDEVNSNNSVLHSAVDLLVYSQLLKDRDGYVLSTAASSYTVTGNIPITYPFASMVPSRLYV